MSTTRREDSKSHKTFKIIVIGDSNVGKTSLTYRFCERKFITTLDVTIGFDLREKTLRIDGEDIKLQVWDTAGQERFRKSMMQQYYRKVHGIVLVYDVTNRASFDSLTYWLDECDRNCLTNVPKALVGNKCDEELVVDTNIAQRFADQHYMPLFETSARFDSECDIVEAIFFFLAHKLKYQKKLIPVEDVGQTQRLTRAANPVNNNSGWTWDCS